MARDDAMLIADYIAIVVLLALIGVAAALSERRKSRCDEGMAWINVASGIPNTSGRRRPSIRILWRYTKN